MARLRFHSLRALGTEPQAYTGQPALPSLLSLPWLPGTGHALTPWPRGSLALLDREGECSHLLVTLYMPSMVPDTLAK